MLILNAAESGVSIRDLYLDVFRVAQYGLGRPWQTNQISVAREHPKFIVTFPVGS